MFQFIKQKSGKNGSLPLSTRGMGELMWPFGPPNSQVLGQEFTNNNPSIKTKIGASSKTKLIPCNIHLDV